MAHIDLVPFYGNNGSHDNWDAFTERFEQFCLAYLIPDNKRGLLLLSSLDSSNYKLLRDMCHPVGLQDTTYQELQRHLHSLHCKPVDIFSYRYHFYNAKQTTDMSVMDWFNKVISLSLSCKFGDRQETILLDRFVSGLLTSPVLLKLYDIIDKNMSLLQIVQIALDLENKS